MIRIYADAVNVAAVGRVQVLQVGIPADQTWKLLEIRTPSDTVQDAFVSGQLNGMTQYEMVPTLNNHDFVIGDQLVGPMNIVFFLDKATADAQEVGVTLVFDQPPAL